MALIGNYFFKTPPDLLLRSEKIHGRLENQRGGSPALCRRQPEKKAAGGTCRDAEENHAEHHHLQTGDKKDRKNDCSVIPGASSWQQ